MEETDYLVITADHGEQFYEHFHWGHGDSLFNEEILILLIIQGPGMPAGLVIPHPVRLIDLYATITEWAGDLAPDELPLQSLQPLLEGEEPVVPRLVYSELLLNQRQFSLLVNTAKIIEVQDAERDDQPFYMTFDLSSNPGEQVRVQPAREGAPLDRSDPSFIASPDLLEALTLVREKASRLQIVGGMQVEAPEEVLDQLRALGYLDD